MTEQQDKHRLRAYRVSFYEEVPQTMLPLLHPTTAVPQLQFPSLAALLDEPFPRTPEDMVPLEQPLVTAAAQTAAQRRLVPLTRAHEDEAVVRQAIAHARAPRAVPLVHKGLRTTSVLLLGGTRIRLEPPSLREDRRGRRGRRRGQRGPCGAGGAPVLERLGLADRVSPAPRLASALHVVQAASSREAADRLNRRGLAWDVSSLVRISTVPAAARARLRETALEAALRLPVPSAGPLAGKRVRVRLDGGRVRTRHTPHGRKTATGRHGCSTPWRAPRVLGIALLDEQGQPARRRVPRYAVLIGDAEAIWALLIGSVRLLGAASADGVELIAAGAAWIGKRVERLSTLAEIPAATRVEVLDFSPASQERSETSATSRQLPQAHRRALSKRLRHALRHQADGVEVVMEAWRPLATRPRGKASTRALRSLEAPTHRMRSGTLEAHKLPIGSGQVESAVRRVINLRCKAPGSFWTDTTVRGLMHLRAACKAGRWDEVMIGVLTGTFQTPRFAPVSQAATHRSAEAQQRDTPQSFIKSRKQAA